MHSSYHKRVSTNYLLTEKSFTDNSVITATAAWRRGQGKLSGDSELWGFGGEAPRKFLGPRPLLWLKMHLPKIILANGDEEILIIL